MNSPFLHRQSESLRESLRERAVVCDSLDSLVSSVTLSRVSLCLSDVSLMCLFL